MSTGDDYVDHLLDLMSGLGPVRPRKMFGGWGFFLDTAMFGLVYEGRFYCKVDDQTRPRFLAGGGPPFVYKARDGKDMEMGYYAPPDEAFDSEGAMAPWARLAADAAGRAAAAKGAKKAKKKPARNQMTRAAKLKSPSRKRRPQKAR